VILDLGQDFLLGLIVRVSPSCLRRHTGIVMDCLVSNQKQHPTALESLYTCI
jgi:hypothetical protein